MLCSKSGVKGDLEFESFRELVISISAKAQKTTSVGLTQSLVMTRDMMLNEDRLRLSKYVSVPVSTTQCFLDSPSQPLPLLLEAPPV